MLNHLNKDTTYDIVKKSCTENPKESEKQFTHTHRLHRNLAFQFQDVSLLSVPHSHSPFVSPTQPAAVILPFSLPQAAPVVWIQQKTRAPQKENFTHTHKAVSPGRNKAQ
jgi:hypothetical protein